MSEINLKNYANDAVMESFFDMRTAQDPKDRLHYFDVVMEGSVETNAILLQKLYTDIVSKSNIDYGTIPDSQGALTKYKEYKLMSESMDRLNRLYEGTSSDELTLMNKLHDMIISCRKDYELGYKFDIEILKITYCTAVMTLFEMINICILAYTRSLRDKKGIDFDFKKVKKKDILVLRGANSLMKCYESGQWTSLMNEIKKKPIDFSSTATATEGFLTDDMKDVIAKGINKVGLFGPDGAPAKLDIKSAIKRLPLPAKIIGGVIMVLMTIRSLIYVFYAGSSKLKDWLKNQKEFIEADIRSEMQDGNTPVSTIEKHKKLANLLENIANFIEIRILKADADAKKDLAESNKENYNKADFVNPVGFGGPIEF